MNNLSSTFTIDDLREIAYRGSYRDSERALASELLALREAGKEPVAYMHIGKGIRIIHAGELDAKHLISQGGWEPLYAAPQLPAVPDGWVMVPKVPTMDMVRKMRYHVGSYDRHIAVGYASMIASAPKLE